MKTTAFKRPFATHYFYATHDALDDYVHQGAAKTEDGAKRSTVVRLILGQYDKAAIYDRRDGTLAYILRRTSQGISISYGRS